MEYGYIIYIIQICFFVSCLMVFCVKKTLHSVFMLITSFVFGAFICIVFEAYFISFLFIIVYVGAIAVLFLFVLMLLDFKDSLGFYNFQFYKSFIFGSVILSMVFYIFYCFFFRTSLFISNPNFSLLNFFIYQHNAIVIGQVLYTVYFIPFLLISIVLFVAMLGAILLTSSSINNSLEFQDNQIYKQNISEQVNADFKDSVILKSPKLKFFNSDKHDIN